MSKPPIIPGEGLPDDYNAEQLQNAHHIISNLVEVDPSSVRYGIELAQRLQGVAGAMSLIGLVRGSLEAAGPQLTAEYAPEHTPQVAARYVLNCSVDPETRRGRTIDVEPAKNYGVTVSVRGLTLDGPRISYDATIPNDEIIDSLLMDDPIFWRETRVQSHDFRDRHLAVAHPFSHQLYREDSTQQYLTVVQDLSRELLSASESAA